MRGITKPLTFCRCVHYQKLFRLVRAGFSPLLQSFSGWQFHFSRTYCDRKYVLGIESSCDDTGAAVVDDTGHVHGEALHSQLTTHIEKYGGIHPLMAKELHQQCIADIVSEALTRANMTVQDMDAIAVTVKPGLLLSLYVGYHYGKELSQKFGKPFIPIHHMQAHALTARMLQRIDFPFLVLLASGGHCTLAVARDIDDYLVIGQKMDAAPGDALDKVARRLNLRALPQCVNLPGGAAVEKMAEQGDPRAFSISLPKPALPTCNFYFAHLPGRCEQFIAEEEKKHAVNPGEVIPSVADVCASVQYNVTSQLVRKLQRGFLYCRNNQLLPEYSTMVLSGGVASNQFIRRNIQRVCEYFDCTLVCPPPKLCTDNGIMVAWNGMEKLLRNMDTDVDPDTITPQARSSLGVDISEQVISSHIQLRRVRAQIS